MLKKTHFFYFSVLLVIMVSFFTHLCYNVNRFPIPNGDFFQYIGDGRQYINFKLPSNIHPPPFVPFLICLVAKIFKSVEYPELFSAYVINFVAATLILLNVFLLLQKKPLLALSTVFLLATNKIYFLASLDLTNEIIYGFFLTLVLLLYQKKIYRLAYPLSGLLFLIRYESIVFQLAIFIVEFFYRRKQFKIKNILVAFTPVIVWLIILNFHSTGTNLLHNAYFLEIYASLKNIPNFDVFQSLTDVILFNPSTVFLFPLLGYNSSNLFLSNSIHFLIPILFFLLFIITFFKKKNTNIKRIVYLTLVLHFLFIAAFPQFCIRYLASVIWIIYLLIIDRSTIKLKILIISLFLIFNLSQINVKSTHEFPTGFGYRYAASWLNQQNLHHPTRVIVYDPNIINYYLHNPNIILDFNSYEHYTDSDNIYRQCQDNMTCVVKNLHQQDQNLSQIYVIRTSYSTLSTESFPDQETLKMHHMAAFKNFPPPQEAHNYKLVQTIGDLQYWAKIYQYLPPETL